MKPAATTLRTIVALSATLAAPFAWAHEGHGMPGVAHWHDTDAWGFIAMAALAAATYNWFKGDK
jgi:hypothetical protein